MSNPSAVLYAAGDLRVEDRPVPEPGPREVLVEIRAVGICGSDVHYYEHGRIGDFVVEAPMVLGHESAGVVVAVGEGAGRHRVGQRVALEPGVPCGGCRQCRDGHYNLCPDVVFFATPPVDGTLARYVTIHEDYAFALPDNVSDEAGALIEPLSVGLWASRKANIQIGDRVAIAGAGPIGVMVALAARASGAAEVVVSDVEPARLEQIRRYGATATVDARGGTLPEVDVFVDCSGAPPAIAAGIRAVRPAGVAVLVGMCASPDLPMPHAAIQSKEIWVTGTFRYANTYPRAIALAASGAVDLDALVGARFPLADSEAALTASRRDPTLLKAVVHP
jgi:L-iditol 2-dehydrogenase